MRSQSFTVDQIVWIENWLNEIEIDPNKIYEMKKDLFECKKKNRMNEPSALNTD